MTVPAAVRALLRPSIGQHADILLILQQIVQTVRPERAARLRAPPLGVEPLDDLPIRPSGGIVPEDDAHRLGLRLADLDPAVDDDIPERGHAAGILPLLSHPAHFLADLLPGLQNPHLIHKRHAALRHERRRVAQIAADHRLSHRYYPDAETLQTLTQREPRGHFAKHTALIIDNDRIRAALREQPHHAVKLRAGLFHAADGLIREHIQHREPLTLAPLAAFADLHFDAVGLLPVGGETGKNISPVC